MENVEIERKWLIDGFPEMAPATVSCMEQGYLSFTDPTVRIRRAETAGEITWRLTIKGRGTLARTEVELPLTESQYTALSGLLAAPPVCKQHRTYPLPGGLTLECNLVDEGQPTSFAYAEVEFESQQEAALFLPLPWLGREVTDDPNSTMAAYTRRKAAEAAK